MKSCLIVNSYAGSPVRRAQLLAQFVEQAKCPVRPTTSVDDIRLLARQAMDEGYERIIVGGGDGTLSQVINGLAPDFPPVELAILPLGTGNDFARSIGITSDNLHDAISTALKGQVRTVDVLKIKNGSTSFCLNAASGGLGGKIASDVDSDDKSRWGAFAYWMTALAKLIDLDQYQLSLQLDDEKIEMTAYGLAITNGRFVGGGFPISPSAYVNDGLLDITAVPVLPALELMAAGLSFTLGRPPDADRLRIYRSRRVHVRAEPHVPFSIDGEPLATVEAIFEVIPNAIRVVVGDDPVAVAMDDQKAGQNAA